LTLIVRAFWSLQEEQRINPHFETLFAVGVDEMSWDDMANEHFDWPPVSQVSIPFSSPSRFLASSSCCGETETKTKMKRTDREEGTNDAKGVGLQKKGARYGRRGHQDDRL